MIDKETVLSQDDNEGKNRVKRFIIPHIYLQMPHHLNIYVYKEIVKPRLKPKPKPEPTVKPHEISEKDVILLFDQNTDYTSYKIDEIDFTQFKEKILADRDEDLIQLHNLKMFLLDVQDKIKADSEIN